METGSTIADAPTSAHGLAMLSYPTASRTCKAPSPRCRRAAWGVLAPTSLRQTRISEMLYNRYSAARRTSS